MNELSLLTRSIHDDMQFLTPQVTKCIDEIQSHHKSQSERRQRMPLVVCGKSGSGISTVMSRTAKQFKLTSTGVVVLQRQDLALYSPYQLLLHHYGFRPADSARLASSYDLPLYITKLLAMAEPEVIILDDFLNGVIGNKDKSKHLAQWTNLANAMPQTSIIFGNPGRRTPTWLSSAPNYKSVYIDEWSPGPSFDLYLSQISDLALTKYGLNMELQVFQSQLYQHSHGNTGNLIRHLRQLVINLMLNQQSDMTLFFATKKLKELIEDNARIFC
ncbi:ATP-binding protein [Pseudomonas sp. S37]|uniref:ATP-binding protein n=1 Tax=Pseudomonas sp. S37 TaxID=2767449 RepID=UPI001913AB62|nr:ATP-binding protein [Pseudomonas sp. S37]MBK4993280.1 ATP-binding protein [Pseudomonas sp. S37]